MSSQPCVCKCYIFNSFWWGGLLTGSDTCIMPKIDAIWLTFVSYGPVVKSHRFDKHFVLHCTCIPVDMVTVITLD